MTLNYSALFQKSVLEYRVKIVMGLGYPRQTHKQCLLSADGLLPWLCCILQDRQPCATYYSIRDATADRSGHRQSKQTSNITSTAITHTQLGIYFA